MRLAIYICLALILTGATCKNWKDQVNIGLSASHEAAKVASRVAEPGWDTKCKAKALECNAKEDKVCSPLRECEKDFRAFNTALKTVHITVASGLVFISLGSKEKAFTALAKAEAALRRLYDLARKHGVM